MGRLKQKIRAATLMETMVATTIILVVFVIASFILNTTYRGVVQHNTFALENRLEQLYYLYQHKQLELPHDETFNTTEISIIREEVNGVSYIAFEAKKKEATKAVIRYYVDE